MPWTKQSCRDWLYRRQQTHEPLPSADELKRQIGRALVEESRREQRPEPAYQTGYF